MAAGEVLGGIVGSRWSPRRPGLVSLAGVLPYPLVLLALAATLPAVVILAGYLAIGVGFMLFGVYWYTALQRAIPADRLGVVLSIDQVGSFGLEPIGYAVAGILAESIGPARCWWGPA
jgi:predicted MFS family arabinose efflux permease